MNAEKIISAYMCRFCRAICPTFSATCSARNSRVATNRCAKRSRWKSHYWKSGTRMPTLLSTQRHRPCVV